MTHRERILRTFEFQETDHAPCDLMEGSVWHELMEDFRTRHGCRTETDVQDVLDTDCRWIRMVNPNRVVPLIPHSRAVAGGPLTDATSVAEIEAYAWPDPAQWQPADCAGFRQTWPDHALVFMPGWRPLFWATCEVFGVEAALMNLAAEPDLFECAVQCIHDRYMDRLTRGLATARSHCDICLLGDDFASQESMMLSPDHWRRYIKPRLAEQVALVRQHDLRVLYHSCGAVRPVLGDLLDIGVHGLLVFQTQAAGMDPESIARDFGGRLVFYGGMDVQHLLSFGSEAEVVAEVRRNLRAFSRCGGYIVANAHHGVGTIKGSNLEIMCHAARNSKVLLGSEVINPDPEPQR